MNFQQLADLQRRQANLIRPGKVASVDLAAARCRVTIGDLLTAPLPFLTMMAGEDRTWHPPEVGEQVLVLSPSGELTAGFVLGGIYTTTYPAQSASGDLAKIKFKDDTKVTYDRALHTLTIDLPTSGSTLNITVNGNATISATGNALVEAEGNATVSAGNIAKVEAGTRVSLTAPEVKVNGSMVVTGDVTAGGISLKTHKHGGVQSGGSQTGTPV